MSKCMRAFWLVLRTVVIALSLLVAVALWYGPSMTIAHPWPSAGPDADNQLAAMRLESWGLFPYYGRAVNTYRTGERYREVEVDRGIQLDGLAITIIGSLALACVLVVAVRPSVARNAIRRLTMRWSGP